MKNIIFIAPPAAGKGTQAKFISKEYNIPHIATGDLLREEIEKNTEIGIQIKNKYIKYWENILLSIFYFNCILFF